MTKCLSEKNRPVAKFSGFDGEDTHLGGKIFVLNIRFQNKVFWALNQGRAENNFGGHCPRITPVAMGLDQRRT